jgi:altronate dehydratase small subunit
MMPRAIVLHPSDNVATLLDPGKEGETCTLQGEGSGQVMLRQDVPFGHKICIMPTSAGEKVLKYGQVIGTARKALTVGEHAHVHNIDSTRARGDLNTR